MLRATALSLIAALFAISTAVPARAEFDWSLYAAFLKARVSRDMVIGGVKLNVVDYASVARDRAEGRSSYRRLLAQLEKFDPKRLASRGQRVAFWINVYNIAAIKVVADSYPVDSIRDSKINIFTVPWGIDVINVGGVKYDLDTIEHEILLGELAEPRAHFALVCASVSCADLSPVPYTASRLDRQLDAAARAFVNSKDKGMRAEREAGVVYVSKVFEWGMEDFNKLGGVREVLAKYLDDPEEREFIKSGRYKIEYMDYNWGLNDKGRAR